MQIDRIHKISSSRTKWATEQPQSKENNSSSSTAAGGVPSASSPIAIARSKPSSSSISNPISATGLQVTTLAATSSNTVSGKSYPESIEESGGIYVASVPSPPGIRATGTTIASAENNLNMKLDTIA